jgi:hypothetical protein
MQILSQNEHFDKRPTNALLAKAVEICAAKGVSHFVYRKYIYGSNSDSQLTEFKRRNGFEQIRFPTYYVPLTVRGRVVIQLGLHLGLKGILPENLTSFLLNLRSKWYSENTSRDSSEKSGVTKPSA